MKWVTKIRCLLEFSFVGVATLCNLKWAHTSSCQICQKLIFIQNDYMI